MRRSNLLSDANKSKRDVVLAFYGAWQRRLDAYRQIAIIMATASIPIATLFIAESWKLSAYPFHADLIKYALIIFTVIVYAGLFCMTCKIGQFFKEFSRNIQYIEHLLKIRQSGVYGDWKLLELKSQPSPTDAKSISGWYDPFIKYSKIAISIVGIFAFIFEVAIFLIA